MRAIVNTRFREVQNGFPRRPIFLQTIDAAGDGGGVLQFPIRGRRSFSAPGLPIEKVMDPTGAGDSFAGGLIGFLAGRKGELRPEVLKQAVIVGSVMASFNVEDFSCRRLKGLTGEEINRRIREFKKLSHFEEVRI